MQNIPKRDLFQLKSKDSKETEVPRVSIVMPVFNKAEFTEKCLYSLVENTGNHPDYELVVVDNGSTDWTRYLLHAFEGDVQVLNNDGNLGFARACNQGAAICRSQYLLFLNNDTLLRPGWLQALVELADSDPKIGVVGAKLLYPDSGKVQHAGLELRDGIPDHAFRGANPDDPRVCKVRDLDMVTGACLLIRRSIFAELRGFDVEYLNGIEDVDLCLQVRQKGYRVVYCPASEVEHYEGSTEGRFDHLQENLQRFVEKWEGHFNAAGRLIVPSEVDAEMEVDRGLDWQVNGEALALQATKWELNARRNPGPVSDQAEFTESEDLITVIFFDKVEEEQRAALVATLGSNLELRNVHVVGDQGLGEQLEEIGRDSSGEFLVFLSGGDDFQGEMVQKLLSHMRREENIALIMPCLQPQAPSDTLVDVESAVPQCTVVRREALDNIGGFDPSFHSVAVLDGVARGCRRQGWRVVCAQNCFLDKQSGYPLGDELLTLKERQAIRGLEDGDRCKDQGDRDAALEAYRKALAAKDDFVEVIMVLGALLLECGRGREAIEVIKRLVDIDSESVQGHNYLGLVQCQTKDWEGAGHSFLQALELDPTYVDALINLGVLEWEQGDAEKAIDYLEQAASLDAGNREVIMNIAMFQAQIGDRTSAIALLQDYTRSEPTDIEAWVLLGDILVQNGEPQLAWQIAVKVIEVQPDNFRAQAILEKVGGKEEK